MITLEWNGQIVFVFAAPEAQQVEVVGAFDGFDEQTVPMTRGDDGLWRAAVCPGPGSYLFRYRVDGNRWEIDEEAHGISEGADGTCKSRVWCPPLRLDPDSLAA